MCVDVFAPATRTCGTTPTDVCDAPDLCAGTSGDCIATFLTDVECRPSAGGCDLPESCTGTAATCPSNVFSASATVCRAATDPACDPTESCDGLSAMCPSDVTSCAARPDAGAERDASTVADSGAAAPDAGAPPEAAGGCACDVPARSGATPGGGTLALAVGVLLALRRTRAKRRGDATPETDGSTRTRRCAATLAS